MELWTPEEKLNYVYAFMKYDHKDIELDFWQDDFIRNRNRYISLLKSRQTGFSFVVAIKGLVKALDPARTQYTKQFVSYNEEDAQEKIRYARQFYDSIPNRYKKKLVHQTATMLEFEDVGSKTTSRLISLPCRPPRGRNGDVCLDEFAIYLPRLSKEIYTAASFCTLRRGCIEVGSTPLGTIGKFYEICTNRESYPNFDRYFIPWWYAKVMCKDVRGAVQFAKDMETAERVERFGTDRLISLFQNSTLEDFQQECECVFIDSSASYISLELIYANTPGRREEDIPANIEKDEDYFAAKRDVEIHCFKDADELILNYSPEKYGSPLFMGLDIGRTSDATVFYIIGVINGKKRSVLRHEMRNADFDAQTAVLNKLMENLPIYRCCIDDGGIGRNLAENAHKRYGERAELYHFGLQSKEILAMGVRTGLERREYELDNDRNFHAQIHSIKRTPSSGGSFRYDAERNEKGHADSFWAWALASYATDGKKIEPNFYAEYARKKNDSVVTLNNGNIEPSNIPQTSLTRTRGKSLSSVLRSVRNGNR
jgi:phage FluMu gp28-like protein